ncbi:hypothetical protein AMTR_s00021p00249570 [Amborella trichopoda]|uniref:Uncharacterized protein n=2 Tax=Amborella trichopoda TaxID=13333 RepID=W1Q136_AMBTC|nr:hypothetical protein AMTR_s00021p00249570 [Amborella trichopoda]
MEMKEKQISVDSISLKSSAPPAFQWESRLPSLSFSSASSSARQALESPRTSLSLCRSKSCGLGRMSRPSDEFMLGASSWKKNDQRNPNPNQNQMALEYEHNQSRGEGKITEKKGGISGDGRVGCGAGMCMFLPGFSKGRQVKERNADEEDGYVISRIASLERFECGSWASSAIPSDGERSRQLYFDLPSELIRAGMNETHSPVTTAFVFGSGRFGGVLKKSNSPRKSSSNRHVQFFAASMPSSPSSSTCVTPRLRKAGESSSSSSHRHFHFFAASTPSSPSSTSVTPRLRKAREEFNAYLAAAQNA